MSADDDFGDGEPFVLDFVRMAKDRACPLTFDPEWSIDHGHTDCLIYGGLLAMIEAPTIYAEIRAERERAHAKHGDTSMEAAPWTGESRRLRVLVEEVGEVAKAFNDHEHGHLSIDELAVEVRKELIQVAAMAAAWADVVPVPEP